MFFEEPKKELQLKQKLDMQKYIIHRRKAVMYGFGKGNLNNTHIIIITKTVCTEWLLCNNYLTAIQLLIRIRRMNFFYQN